MNNMNGVNHVQGANPSATVFPEVGCEKKNLDPVTKLYQEVINSNLIKSIFSWATRLVVWVSKGLIKEGIETASKSENIPSQFRNRSVKKTCRSVLSYACELIENMLPKASPIPSNIYTTVKSMVEKLQMETSRAQAREQGAQDATNFMDA